MRVARAVRKCAFLPTPVPRKTARDCAEVPQVKDDAQLPLAAVFAFPMFITKLEALSRCELGERMLPDGHEHIVRSLNKTLFIVAATNTIRKRN
jgi:hypothetical protein